MKTFKKIAAAAVAAGLAVSGITVPGKADAATTVSVSPLNKYEINDGVFQGWGTSLCWGANRVGYSDTLAQKTADLFYGQDGLRMNIARFNIGGGDDPTHKHITRTDSNMPGYTVYKNGTVTYDIKLREAITFSDGDALTLTWDDAQEHIADGTIFEYASLGE